jgi:hypothetical protein
MDKEKYIDLFWINYKYIICIKNNNNDDKHIKEEFNRIGIQNKVILYYTHKSNSLECYQDICKAVLEHNNNIAEDIIIFHDNFIFNDKYKWYLTRLALAQNIYSYWDTILLGCQKPIFKKEFIKNDVFNTNVNNACAIILSSKVVKSLTKCNLNLCQNIYNNDISKFLNKEFKIHLTSARPICEIKNENSNELLQLSSTDEYENAWLLWKLIGRNTPIKSFGEFIQNIIMTRCNDNSQASILYT